MCWLSTQHVSKFVKEMKLAIAEGGEDVSFGEYLKNIRCGVLSQRALADVIGVNFTYLSKIENEVMPPPSEEVLIKIANALDVDSYEIVIEAKKIPSRIKSIILEFKEVQEFLKLVEQYKITPVKWEKIKNIIIEE